MKSETNIRRGGYGLIILAYIAFISLGLPDGLLGVAWPSMRHTFSRSLDSLGMLLLASTAGYLISSFYSGQIMQRLGVGWLLSLSCAMTGAGMLGYTLVPFWWMMIPLAISAGLGAGAIDAGINTYVAANYGERLMQWLHASFGIGITMGPLIMTLGLDLTGDWRLGYIAVGTSQILLSVCFGLTHSLWKKNKGGDHYPDAGQSVRVSVSETLRQSKVWMSIFLFFIYAGIEASLGSWAYSLLTESRGVQAGTAGLWVGSYWGAFTLGRILAGIFTRHIPTDKLIRTGMLAAFAGSAILMWNPFSLSSLLAVAITGIAIAPIFPGMVSLTGKRVSERYMVNTIGMQMSAAGLGLAAIPSAMGVLAERTSLEAIPVTITILIVVLFIIYLFAARRPHINS